MKIKRSFRTRLLISTSMIFMISIGLVVSISNSFARRNLETRLISQEIPSHVENILGEIDEQFLTIAKALSTLAEDPFLQEWLINGEDPKHLSKIQERLRLNVEHFGTMGSNLSSATSRNYYQYGKGAFKVTKLADTDTWFNAFGESGSDVKINPYTNHIALGEVAFMNIRIDNKGEFLGIISISLKLSDFINKIENKTIGELGQNMMISTDGVIQLHKDKSLIGKLPLSDLGGYSDHINEITSQSEYHFKYKNDDKDVIIVNTRYIPELNWYLIMETSESELFSAIEHSVVMSLAVAGIFLLAGMILLFLFTGVVVKELKTVVSAVDDLSMGDGDLTKQIGVKSKDEAGVLAQSIDSFILNMRRMIVDLKKTSHVSSDIGMNLASNAEEISATVTEVSATMNSINNQTGQLTGEIQNSDKLIETIQEVLTKLENLIDLEITNINSSSSAVEEMVATIKSISKISNAKKTSIDSLIQIAQMGDRDMDSTVRAIKDISESVDAMQDMISVIKDVSDQINLLSMNAAIEAAHAGDAGKGFAVVADEVRKLADTTSENTKVISKSLSDVIDNIQNANNLSGNTGVSIKKIMSEIIEVSGSISEIITSIDEMSGGTNQITTSLSDLVKISSEVKSSSDEMVSSTREIKESFGQVIDLAQQSKNGIREINTGMEEISSALVNLSELGTLNAQNLNQVNTIVGKFKTEVD